MSDIEEKLRGALAANGRRLNMHPALGDVRRRARHRLRRRTGLMAGAVIVPSIAGIAALANRHPTSDGAPALRGTTGSPASAECQLFLALQAMNAAKTAISVTLSTSSPDLTSLPASGDATSSVLASSDVSVPPDCRYPSGYRCVGPGLAQADGYTYYDWCEPVPADGGVPSAPAETVCAETCVSGDASAVDQILPTSTVSQVPTPPCPVTIDPTTGDQRFTFVMVVNGSTVDEAATWWAGNVAGNVQGVAILGPRSAVGLTAVSQVFATPGHTCVAQQVADLLNGTFVEVPINELGAKITGGLPGTVDVLAVIGDDTAQLLPGIQLRTVPLEAPDTAVP